jgi:hypothetical protein
MGDTRVLIEEARTPRMGEFRGQSATRCADALPSVRLLVLRMDRLGDSERSQQWLFATDGQGCPRPRSDEGEYTMRGVNRPTPWHHSPQGRSGVRSAGRAGGVVARTAAIVATVGATALMAASPAMAQVASGHLTSGQSATAVSVAQSDPMVFGLGLAGLFWLLAGLLALAVGLVLATRQVRRPAAGGANSRRAAAGGADSRRPAAGGAANSRPTAFSPRSTSTSTSHDRAGGAEK